MAVENPILQGKTEKFLLKLPGKDEAESFEALFEPATILVRRARQLYALERRDGVKPISYKDGTCVFDKDGFRYVLNSGYGIDASLSRSNLRENENGQLNGVNESFWIQLNLDTRTSKIFYAATKFEDGQMITDSSQDNQEALDAINQMVTSVDGEFFSER